jgi:RND superfamily putative drug exporter
MSRKSKGGIAARAGRWSAQHRKTAILGWLAVVIAAFVLGGPFGTGTQTVKEGAGTGESGRAQTIQD